MSTAERRVVVVDGQRHVLGIITDGDLLREPAPESALGCSRRLLVGLRAARGAALDLASALPLA